MDMYTFGFLNACFGATFALVYQRLREKYKGKIHTKQGEIENENMRKV